MILLNFCTILLVVLINKQNKNVAVSSEFQGTKLQWKEDDGLEIKIIRPISKEKCTILSQAGDTVEQVKNEISGENNHKLFSFIN